MIDRYNISFYRDICYRENPRKMYKVL